MAIVGAFGTDALPLATRLPFWFGLIGWNALKWQLWFALTVRRPADWLRAALAGTLLVDLPLPLEIEAALDLAGVAAVPARAEQLMQALAISALVFAAAAAVAWISRRQRNGERALRSAGPAVGVAADSMPMPAEPCEAANCAAEPSATASEGAPPAASLVPDLLHRAGITDTAFLQAIQAEDHYCRFRLADGRAPLLHCRFRDALAAVAALDGAQVSRGLWLASAMVAAARREDRRWWLDLGDGRAVAVSASYVGAVKARGWLDKAWLGPACRTAERS